MGNLGAPELLIILAIVVVFFGARKIPEIAQGIGKGIREFRKASKEIERDDNGEKALPEQPTASAKGACPHCGAPIAGGAKFCPACGRSLEQMKCPKCGSLNAAGNKFCGDCGEKL